MKRQPLTEEEYQQCTQKAKEKGLFAIEQIFAVGNNGKIVTLEQLQKIEVQELHTLVLAFDDFDEEVANVLEEKLLAAKKLKELSLDINRYLNRNDEYSTAYFPTWFAYIFSAIYSLKELNSLTITFSHDTHPIYLTIKDLEGLLIQLKNLEKLIISFIPVLLPSNENADEIRKRLLNRIYNSKLHTIKLSSLNEQQSIWEQDLLDMTMRHNKVRNQLKELCNKITQKVEIDVSLKLLYDAAVWVQQLLRGFFDEVRSFREVRITRQIDQELFDLCKACFSKEKLKSILGNNPLNFYSVLTALKPLFIGMSFNTVNTGETLYYRKLINTISMDLAHFTASYSDIFIFVVYSLGFYQIARAINGYAWEENPTVVSLLKNKILRENVKLEEPVTIKKIFETNSRGFILLIAEVAEFIENFLNNPIDHPCSFSFINFVDAYAILKALSSRQGRKELMIMQRRSLVIR